MTIDIDAIRKREQAATPGPWSMRDGWGPSNEGGMRFRRIANATHDGVIEPTHDGELAALQADAEFIAHARQDIPALLAEVEQLRADIAEKERREDRAAKKVDGLQAYLQDSLTLGTAEVRNLSLDLAAIHDDLAGVA